MPGRSYTGNSYRYGFNGKEKDDEVKGSGNSLDFGARIHDSRLGRFLSIDPLFRTYPDLSPYAFAANSPIIFIDQDGKGPGFGGVGIGMWSYISVRSKQLQAQGYSTTGSLFRAQAEAVGIPAAVTVGTVLGVESAPSVAASIWKWGSGLMMGGATYAASNPNFVVGVGGLTASILDPNPLNDYPENLDDVARGLKVLFKGAGGESKFILNSSKFDFFFGKVKAGINATQRELDNAYKSAERSGIFEKLGISEAKGGKDKLTGLFNDALEKGKEIGRYTDDNGLTITKQIGVKNGETSGSVNVSFLYRGGDVNAVPEITTAVPKLNE